MGGIKQLDNKGISFIGDKTAVTRPEKTLVVVGIARGGTSLISGSLHHLGVFVGQAATAPVFEDLYLSQPMEQNDDVKLQQIIASYNQQHAVWGFKRPNIINHLEKMHQYFKNPIYFFVFKDIFSIANRNTISMKTGLLSGVKAAYNDYGKVLAFIENNTVNGYLLSYDKILRRQQYFINLLADIIGSGQVTEVQKQSALEFINPNSHSYLNASRITRGKGSIDQVTPQRVAGWARYINDERVAEVELYVNDKKIMNMQANHFREDLLNKNVHSTGKCAYIFDLHEGFLQHGDKVNVKIVDEIVFLKETPRVFFSNYVK